MPVALTAADVARWWRHIAVTDTCWIWMGSIGSDGYGRFAIRQADGLRRMLTAHQVAAIVAFGQIPVGATVMHDCDTRLCCRTTAGHVRVATQAENLAQAAARGRLNGSKPGLVDVRGPAGASRAIQRAIRDRLVAQRAALAEALAATRAEGDPRAGLYALFDVGDEPATDAPAVGDGELFRMITAVA